MAAANYTGAGAADLNFVPLQQLDNSRRSARHKRWLAQSKLANISRMKTVDVLGRINRFNDWAFVNQCRPRQLHQDAVDIFARIKLREQLQQVACRRGGRLSMMLRA